MEGAGKVHSPWYKFLSLPSLPLPFSSKMAAIIFAKKRLSTHSPKLRVLFLIFHSDGNVEMFHILLDVFQRI